MKKLKTILEITKLIKNSPIWFLNYFEFRKKKFSLYFLRNGLKFITHSNNTDASMIHLIWNRDIYKTTRIKEGDTVVDVGANIGIFTILASKLVGNEGRVYAIEPDKENYELLRKNLELNKIKNVRSFNIALGKKNEKRKLFKSKENPGAHSFYPIKNSSEFKIIDVISFDNLIKKNKIKKINFLKMDCEGAEYEILFNLSENNLKNIKNISMEVHNTKEKKFLDMIAFLEKNKFVVKKGKSLGKDTLMIYSFRKM